MLGLGANITKSAVKGADTWSTPADFGANLIAWYRKGATYMIKEGTSSPPTTQGEEIKMWDDQSIFSNDAENTTSANLPQIDIDNDDGSLWLNHNNDFLHFTEITFAGEFAIYIKLLVETTINADMFMADKDATNKFWRINDADELRGKFAGGAMKWIPYASLSADTFYRIGLERDSSDLMTASTDGNNAAYDATSAYGSSAVNGTTFTFDQIGGGSTPGDMIGRIKEIVIVNRGLTIPERVYLDQYLQTL